VTETKRLLLIAYSYPPLEDAQSLRWYYLSQELAKLGCHIDVVTIDHPAEMSYKISSNITIHRVYPGFFENIANRFKNRIGVDGVQNQQKRRSFSFSFMKRGYWLVRSLVGGVLPGNITSEWYPWALSYIHKNLDMQAYDMMITSHEPWVDALLGLRLKKKYPQLKWVGDFGDPYVSVYTPKYKRFFENRLERKIYENIDLLVLTNQKVFESLQRKYAFLEQKESLILEQGFVERTKKRASVDNKSTPFTILYTGTFYEDFRNPKQLAEALKMLTFDFRFIVAGRNEAFDYLFRPLGEKYRFLGFTSHQEVLRLQERADVLVHLSNKQIEQVPGKFFEYLGAKRSVLLIYQNENDQLISFAERMGISTVCPNNAKSIAQMLQQMYDERGKASYNADEIAQYSWQARALKLYQKIQAL